MAIDRSSVGECRSLPELHRRKRWAMVRRIVPDVLLGVSLSGGLMAVIASLVRSAAPLP